LNKRRSKRKSIRIPRPIDLITCNSQNRQINAPGQLYFILLSQDAVVYIGHLPHGFLEEQLNSYFSQYGEVLAVKVARSKKTSRSKGYAFIQFKYAEVAHIVSDTMNGYLLLGKVLVSHTLPPT
jgi:RNA recognition motif-containing protein